MSYFVVRFLLLTFSLGVFASMSGLPEPRLVKSQDAFLVSWQLADNLYLNAKSVNFFVDNKKINYLISGKDKLLHGGKFYTGDVVAALKLPAHARGLAVEYQGCSSSGVCFAPQKTNISLVGSVVMMLVALFAAGIVLAFTPCALPIAPLAIASMSKARNRMKNAVCFLLGVVLFYAILGVVVFSLGLPLQQLAQTPVVLVVFSCMIFFMAIGMLELSPNVTQKMYSLMQKLLPDQGVGNGISLTIFGAVTMLVATPCVAPPLLAALAWASQMNSVLYAALGLSCMGFGLGLPAVVASFFGLKLTGCFNKSNIVQLVIGYLLIFTVLVFMARVVDFWGFVAVWLVSLILMLAAGIKFYKSHGFSKSLLLLVIVCCYVLLGFYLKPDTSLIKEHKALDYQTEFKLEHGKTGSLVYFHADWCIACKEVEKSVLADSLVAQRLTHWQTIGVDLTTGKNLSLQRKWRIIGPPAVVLLDTNGNVLSKLEGLERLRFLPKVLEQLALNKVKEHERN